MVVAAWAALLAFLTAETRPAAGTDRMLTTMAVGIMLEALVTMRFGGFSRPLPSPGIERSISVLGAGVYPQELLIPLAAILSVIGLGILRKRTLIGRSMRNCPARGVVPTPSTVTPTLPSVLSMVGMMAKMPIDPVSVAGLAQISSAGAEM